MRRRSRTLWVALGRSGTLLGRSGALWDARRRAARIRSGAKLVPLQIHRPKAEGHSRDRRQGHNRGRHVTPRSASVKGTTTYFWRAPGGRGFEVLRAFSNPFAFWQRVRIFARFLEHLAAKHNVEPLVSATEDARGLCSSYPEVDGISERAEPYPGVAEPYLDLLPQTSRKIPGQKKRQFLIYVHVPKFNFSSPVPWSTVAVFSVHQGKVSPQVSA